MLVKIDDEFLTHIYEDVKWLSNCEKFTNFLELMVAVLTHLPVIPL